ncbi:hypothetical protein BS50DRAFT_632919 [Corynespora cassiicola Philippines]|uniref:Uncharacterized protein n=1 Tax=Corynespora cassiicola Philippines TaxID=1448308 RepID=A0A2T2NUJ5_CORCC|nr:hypothetical protein BS50DRAFT_632919 [Corynespora cassiicola Philippines]
MPSAVRPHLGASKLQIAQVIPDDIGPYPDSSLPERPDVREAYAKGGTAKPAPGLSFRSAWPAEQPRGAVSPRQTLEPTELLAEHITCDGGTSVNGAVSPPEPPVGNGETIPKTSGDEMWRVSEEAGYQPYNCKDGEQAGRDGTTEQTYYPPFSKTRHDASRFLGSTKNRLRRDNCLGKH